MSDDPTRAAAGKTVQGHGGEIHQPAQGGLVMTTAQGAPISDDQNSLRVGSSGPTLLEDFVLRDKIFHFDHERIPERVVHARGYGARGTFETLASLGDLTCADIFQRVGEKTEAFVRFSTVAGNKGSFDLARDVRGFAVKLYTRQGNWDIVGNNIPVFFIQDAIKFPDLVHSVKEAPDRAFPQAQSAHDNFWDFVSFTPEAIHMTLWQMSDRAIPRSFRFMEGFGVHTFRFVDAAGGSRFVKFHWKPAQGLQSVLWNEAVKINGADPDFHRRDLWDAITSGSPPSWDLAVQVFDDDFAEHFEFDVLDPTKIIPEEQVPLRVIGRLTLDEVVDNDFAQTEQVAFCTQNIVPGIDFSDDPLLQGRNFSYLDTQLSRLGSTNFTHLPVNAPRCPVVHFQRDGHMQPTVPVGRANYEPNGWDGEQRGPRADAATGFTSYPADEAGPRVRHRSPTFADHYSQARQFWISQTAVEQAHIVDAYTFELGKCEVEAVRQRIVAHLRQVDDELASRVAAGLGLPLPDPAPAAVPPRTDLPPSDSLSILKNGPSSFAGRRLGLLTGEGAEARTVLGVKSAVEAEGATVQVIAPVGGRVSLSDGSTLVVEQLLEGAPSVLYDAVALLPGAGSVGGMAAKSSARDFVSDAFAHHKFIGYTEAARPLLVSAGVADRMDEGLLDLDVLAPEEFVRRLAGLRHWEREVSP
ncbi:catalase [Austwickia chelonae]|uniref:Catalase n=1 Tax=Austwickia chelonae NBRC 105200 TaxID=1184607 RepID=K6VNT1_9MICO|nr:catalase [Austwickia chelonae]GAB78399.1 catalase KatE [Austwickia chelonae NBRC 105200]SEW39224.1 catalase [Austwickia chelonae]